MDYFEDRLAAAGKHEAFSDAVDKFRSSRMGRRDQDVLFDAMVALGVTEEEADEFINLELECA